MGLNFRSLTSAKGVIERDGIAGGICHIQRLDSELECDPVWSFS